MYQRTRNLKVHQCIRAKCVLLFVKFNDCGRSCEKLLSEIIPGREILLGDLSIKLETSTHFYVQIYKSTNFLRSDWSFDLSSRFSWTLCSFKFKSSSKVFRVLSQECPGCWWWSIIYKSGSSITLSEYLDVYNVLDGENHKHYWLTDFFN